MATRIPLILNQTTGRIEELAASDTLPGSIVEAYGGKNLLINGDFGLWQRGTTFTTNASTGIRFCADRWTVNAGAGAEITIASNALAASDVDNVQSLTKALPKFTFTTSNDVGHYALLEQRIESVHSLAGKNAVVSFRVFLPAGVSRYIAVELAQHFQSATTLVGIGPKKYLVNPGWNTIVHPVSVPSTAGKATAFRNFLDVAIWFSGGSNWNSRTDNLGPQPSGEIYLADMQIEEGTNRTAFENRHPAIELELCQRYYEKSYNLGVAPGATTNEGRIAIAVQAAPSSFLFVSQRFAVRKRNAPGIVVYPATSLTITPGNVAQDDGSLRPVTVNNIGSGGFELAWFNTSGRFGGWFHWTADAEM